MPALFFIFLGLTAVLAFAGPVTFVLWLLPIVPP
jgi:hypothetical protein